MVLPWLGPQVAAAPFAARWGAYVAALSVHHFAVIAVLSVALGFLERVGKIRRSTKQPVESFWRMFEVNVEVRGARGVARGDAIMLMRVAATAPTCRRSPKPLRRAPDGDTHCQLRRASSSSSSWPGTCWRGERVGWGGGRAVAGLAE
jgi:hypothetical protein